MFKSPPKKTQKRQTKSLPMSRRDLMPKSEAMAFAAGRDAGDDGGGPTVKRSSQSQMNSSRTRRRTADDFLLFCQIILDYTKYEQMKQQDHRRRHNSSPSLGSTGSGNESLPRSSTSGGAHDLEDDEDSDDVVDRRRNRRSAPPSSKRIPKKPGRRGRKPNKNKFQDIAAAANVDGDDTGDDFDDDSNPDADGDDDDDEAEDWNQVTCYCGRPFAGRPMIECSSCLTWVHLKCAKLTRQRIPETWFCEKCKTLKGKDELADRKLTVKKSLKEKKDDAMVGAKKALLAAGADGDADADADADVDVEKISGSRKRKLTSRRKKLPVEDESTKSRRVSSDSELSNNA